MLEGVPAGRTALWDPLNGAAAAEQDVYITLPAELVVQSVKYSTAFLMLGKLIDFWLMLPGNSPDTTTASNKCYTMFTSMNI